MTENKQRALGIIAGMGPFVTAHFADLVVRMTKAERDQEHLDMIIYHTPSIPDRSSYILDPSLPSPLEPMVDIGKRLEEQQVGCIAIPCVTAHYFHEALSKELSVPVIHAVKETAALLQEAGVKKVGILATTGTVNSGLVQKELEKLCIEAVVPSAQAQQDVMYVIFDCVKANRPVDMSRFENAAAELKAQGAEMILIGCTELSLVKRDHKLGSGYIDALEVLARKAVLTCGGGLKEEYRNLIVK